MKVLHYLKRTARLIDWLIRDHTEDNKLTSNSQESWVTLLAAKGPSQKMRPMNNSWVFISVCSSRWSLNGQEKKKPVT